MANSQAKGRGPASARHYLHQQCHPIILVYLLLFSHAANYPLKQIRIENRHDMKLFVQQPDPERQSFHILTITDTEEVFRPIRLFADRPA